MRHWDETEKQILLPHGYKDPLPPQIVHWKMRVMLFQDTQFRIHDSRVLTSPERWRITLFSQKSLISQLCLHYYRKWNTILWEIEIIFPSVFLSGLHVKTVSQCYFVIFVHPQLNAALQLSFYVSPFAWGIFVLVEDY